MLFIEAYSALDIEFNKLGISEAPYKKLLLGEVDQKLSGVAVDRIKSTPHLNAREHECLECHVLFHNSSPLYEFYNL